MLSQAHRYIFRQTALTLLGAAAAFTAVVWLVYSLRFLDLVGTGAVPASTVFTLALLNLPRFVGLALPIALFCAVLLVFRRLAADGELVALRAAGLGNVRLAAAPMALALAAAALTAAINLVVAPEAAQAYRERQHAVRLQQPLATIRAGKFQSPQPGLTIFAAAAAPDGSLSGLLVRDARMPGRSVTLTARSAHRIETAQGAVLALGDGVRQERDEATGRIATVRFERYVLTAAALAGIDGPRATDPSEMSVGRLLQGDTGWASPGTAARLSAEGHHRLASILHAPAMALVALFFLLHPKALGQPARSLAAPAIVAALALQAAFLAARWGAARHPWLIPAMYVLPLVPALVATGVAAALLPLGARARPAALPSPQAM